MEEFNLTKVRELAARMAAVSLDGEDNWGEKNLDWVFKGQYGIDIKDFCILLQEMVEVGAEVKL